MNATRSISSALALSALAVASFGFAADDAFAAYKARVAAGTLTIRGDGASDKLALSLQPASPSTLQIAVKVVPATTRSASTRATACSPTSSSR